VIEFLETEQRIMLIEQMKHPGMIDKLLVNPLNESQLYVMFSEGTFPHITQSSTAAFRRSSALYPLGSTSQERDRVMWSSI
jgi:hypothetical protein